MPVHLPATGSVWAISDTANKSITIARGLLEAATSDDISAAALLACGSFGSLLPVSPETRLKVEQLARRNHTSHVLNFVKAQVGYKKDDSVEQLSRSDSGIRFLCLVATLCTLDHYEAADRLDAMLQATQQDLQIRPTIKQLQVMLNSMRTKMVLSDFATSVAGFEMILRASLEGLGNSFQIGIAQVPTRESLQDLIIAMNRLGRISDEDSVDSIDVRLSSCHAPWTCAFIKWLLGVPPLIRIAQGKTLLHQDPTSVTITITPQSPESRPSKRTADGRPKLEVIPVEKIRGLRDIIFLDPANERRSAWQGLVCAKTWFDYQFSVLFDKFPQLKKEGKLRNALGQGLYFIVARLPERLVFCEDICGFKSAMSAVDGTVEDCFHPASPKAFLNAQVRIRIAKELIEDHIGLVQEDLDDTGTLLPQNLAGLLGAGCRQCKNPTNDIIAGQLPCRVHELLEGISELGSMLLTISLFGPHSDAFPMLNAGLMFDTTPFHHRLYPLRRKHAISGTTFPRLIMMGWQALMHGQCAFLSCPSIAVFKHAAKMMGHQKIWESTIVSSLYGQVLLPAFFEAPDFLREGFLQMSAFPGKLQKDNMQFDFLLDSWSNEIHTEGVSDAGTEEVGSVSNGEDVEEEESGESNRGEDDEEMAENDHEDRVDSGVVQTDTSVNDGDNMDSIVDYTAPADPDGTQGTSLTPSFTGAKRRLTIPGKVMKWSISVRDEILHGELRLQDDGQKMIAWSLIESMARARLSPPCPHSYNNPAGVVADAYQMASEFRLQGPGWPRSLVVVGQRYAEQLSAVESQDNYPPVVVHVDGCIKCALQLGLEDPVRLVIS